MKKKYYLSLLIIVVLMIVTGMSYALWVVVFEQSGENDIQSGCFRMNFEEQTSGIGIEEATPLSDKEGMQLKPYTFTITNVCGDIASYQVNLESLNLEQKHLPYQYIKVELNQNTPLVLNKYKKVETTLENDKDSYKLISGSLRENESVSYDLRIWLDEEMPYNDETSEASFLSKVTVIASTTTEENIENEINGGNVSNTEDYNVTEEEITLEVSSEKGMLQGYYVSQKEMSKEELDQISNWEMIVPETKELELSLTFTEKGIYYVYFRDEYGSYYERIVEVIKVDKEGPEIKEITSDSEWSTKSEIRIQVIDDQSGIIGYQVTKEREEPSEFIEVSKSQEEQILTYEVKENGIYYVWVKDFLGNISSKSIEIRNIDDLKPRSEFVLGSNTAGNNNWYKSLSVKVQTSDEGMGVRSAKYCITTGSSCIPNIDANLSNNEYSVGLESNANAQRVCSIVTDQAGNESDIECSNAYLVDGVVGSSSFSIQSQTAGNSGWYQALTLKVSLSDIHSGVSSAKYCVTTGSSCTPNVNASISNNAYSVTLGSNASAQRVCSIVTDQAGNTSVTQCSGAYSVDTVNPVAKITASVSGNSITVSGASSSDADSKIASYQYSKDGTNYSSSTSSTFNFTGLNDGSYTVYVKVVDKSGRVSSPVSTSVDVAYVNVYVSSSGNDSTGFGSSTKPFATLSKAYSRVKSGGTILLLSNITQSSTAGFSTANKSVTLKSNGSSVYSVIKASNLTTPIISVNNTNTLTTTNITFNGNNVASIAPVISVEGSSVMYLNSGSTIRGGKNSTEFSGGGISVIRATLHMNGATVTANITNNQGGGIYLDKSTFNLNSGTISNNSLTATDSGGSGGGIFHWGGTFNMKGGTVSGNSAPFGAGIYSGNNGVFNLSTGTIQNNTASKCGGGIYLTGANFIMTGGIITGNKAVTNSGGGIAITNSATAKLNGGSVTSNTAASGFKGGVAAWSNGTYTVGGTTISGNSPSNT